MVEYYKTIKMFVRSFKLHGEMVWGGGGVSKINYLRASLVAQWLRARLLMQATWVQALVQENPTCRGAAGPVRHGC